MKIHLPEKKEIYNRIKHIELPDIKMPAVKVKIPVPEQFFPQRYEISAFSCAVLTAAFTLLIFGALYNSDGWIKKLLFSAALLLSGWEVFLSLTDAFSEKQFFCEETVCILAAAADMVVGNFGGAASIMLGFRLLRLVERLIEKKIDDVVDELDIPVPKKATVETEYENKRISVKKIRRGMIVVVGKKEIIPVDGLVIEGKSSVELYPLTGISQTIAVAEGDQIFSGSINMSGRLYIKASCKAAQSEAAVLGNYIFDACTLPSEKEERMRRSGQMFFAFFSVLGLLLGIAVALFTGWGWSEWISRGALVSAFSGSFILLRARTAAMISGMAVCASHGIIVKNSGVFEKTAKAATFVFNKTGTLTEKKFTVEEVFAENVSEYELLSIAAAAEQYSKHPIARAICSACPGYERFEKDQIIVEEIPCRGVSATIKGRHIFVGNAGLLEEHGIRCRMAKLGTTAAHVAVNGKYCGYIVLSNRIKENAFDAIEALRAQNINNLVMLTGDLHTVSRRVASYLNMDLAKAELTKKDKRDVVRYLAENNDSEIAAYVCCGCEDEALFAAAEVGIAVGALGNRAAEESADVLILKDDLEQVSECVSIAAETLRKNVINHITFIAVKLFVFMFALSGILSEFPLFAAEIAAAVFVMYNSFSMLKNKEE